MTMAMLQPDTRPQSLQAQSNVSSYDTATTHADSRIDVRAVADEDHSQDRSSNTSQDVEKDAQAHQVVAKHDRGWRRIVRNFYPQFYTIVMGTGVTGMLLNRLPYNGSWLYWISVVFFALTSFLWCSFLAISILRYTLYPKTWTANLRSSGQAVFIAACPTGLSTIINLIVYICVPAFGYNATLAAWILWWIDAAASTLACLYLPYRIMLQPDIHLSSVNATYLFPMVAAIVASASGSVVAGALTSPGDALCTIVTSYVILGIGLLLALLVFVILFARWLIHGLPSQEVVVAALITQGPLGSGAFAFMQLGMVARSTFPKTRTLPADTANPGDILFVAGWLIGMMIWGFSIVWLFFAVMAIAQRRAWRHFNMTWWAFTFPLGVFALATVQLGIETPSRFFKVLSTIESVAVFVLWLVVAVGTLRLVWKGKVWYDPSLEEMGTKKMVEKEEGEKTA